MGNFARGKAIVVKFISFGSNIPWVCVLCSKESLSRVLPTFLDKYLYMKSTFIAHY
jgi:hypothetical protein